MSVVLLLELPGMTPAMGDVDAPGAVSAPRVVQVPLHDRWSG